MKSLKKIILSIDNSSSKLFKLTCLAIISGLSSFAFIAGINQIIQLLINRTFDTQIGTYTLMICTLIPLYFITRRLLSLGIINFTQSMFWGIRKNIIDLVLKSPFDKLGSSKSEIYSVFTVDVNNITGSSLLFIDIFVNTIVIGSCFVYMAFLSISLTSISLLFVAAGFLIYHFTTKKLERLFEISRGLEVTFLNYFNMILNGFKEITIEPTKGKNIYQKKITPIINEAFGKNEQAFKGFMNNELSGQFLFYILITFVTIFGGYLLNIKTDIVISFTFILLYVLGPLDSIITKIPSISKAIISAEKIASLEKKLVEGMDSSDQVGTDKFFAFDTIALQEIEYSYTGSESQFGIGPVNFTINKGEIIFIHGANGSGKTTFIYSLLGLYEIQKGAIYIDGVKVCQDNDYKQLFSPIFSDFYLFDEMYSVEVIDTKKLQYYLNLFEIQEKVQWNDGKFSTLNLSTGQRKRLALISALLEKKPLIILDEWAADQDPYFKKRFYTEILQILKKEGFTIVAITHDDNYYHCADKLFRMTEGQLYLEDKKVYAFVSN